MSANVKNTIDGVIDFIQNPKKVMALGMAAASLSLVTACGPSEPKETVSPLPSATQINNDNDTSGSNACVGQVFLQSNGTANIPAAQECLETKGKLTEVFNDGSSKDLNGDGKRDWGLCDNGGQGPINCFYIMSGSGKLVDK